MSEKTASPRKYVTPKEAENMIQAAGAEGRNGSRDRALIMLLFSHGLRRTEAMNLRWSTNIDLSANRIHVTRLKGSNDAVHPLRGIETRALRQLRRDWPDGDFLFQSERGGQLSADMIARIVARAGEKAGVGFHVHPHMLRHACGFFLANKREDTRAIQDYLGHKNIQHTVAYTRLRADRFDNFFGD